MDDLGKILAQTVLRRIREIEEDSNLEQLIDSVDAGVSREARLIKEKMNHIRSALESI